MLKARTRLLVIAGSAMVACSSDNSTAPEPIDRPAASVAQADSLAIRAVIARLDTAWTAMDPVAFAKEFSADAQFVSIIGARMIGQPEVLSRHQFLFGGPFKGSRLQTTIIRQQFLGPTAASVESDSQLTGYVGLPAGVIETSPGALRTRFVHVLQKSNGVWRIRTGQNTSIAP